MLSGRRKKDYEAESAANALASQASVYGDEADIAGAGVAIRAQSAVARRCVQLATRQPARRRDLPGRLPARRARADETLDLGNCRGESVRRGSLGGCPRGRGTVVALADDDREFTT